MKKILRTLSITVSLEEVRKWLNTGERSGIVERENDDLNYS